MNNLPPLVNNLPLLVNIIDTISIPSKIKETDIDELRESIYLIVDDYITNNIKEYKYYDFYTRLFDHTYKIVDMLYENISDMIDLTLSDLVDEGIYSYFEIYGIKRSETTKETTPKNKRTYSSTLTTIKKKDTHIQGTKEWFDFRWNHITASSAWKALEENDSPKNQLILSKCKPINPAKYSTVNICSAMHHGHKFEPLSTMIYEKEYDTIVTEYGCIESEKYHYLGASPDGINTKINNPRYGRLLEIKNPTSRDITGTPKKDYWIQMQLQMEVLNLDECDFLETSFKEYPDEKTYRDDGNFNLSKEKQKKGVIICFNDGNKPFYEYCPLDIDNYDDYEKWRDNIIDQHDKLTWINDTYWYLKKKSCVLVRRNQKWFNSVEHKFKELWNIVLKERESGWEHRKPKSRSKKSHNVQPTLSITTPPLTAAEEPTQNKQDTPTTVFKIDTQILGDASISMDIDSD